MTLHASILPSFRSFQEQLQTIIAAPARMLDELGSQVWAANGAGRFTDDEAQQLDAARHARRTVLEDRRKADARARYLARQKPGSGMRQLGQGEENSERAESIRKNRIKTFGMGRPKPMSRHDKVNLMRKAQRLRHERSTEPGKHVTRADVDVFRALLWDFHNAVTGLCFPSYEAIAEAAGCARSTVYESIKRLEAAGLLSWDHRLKRVFETVVDLFGKVVRGQRSQVQRTSNAYTFFVEESSKSENTSRTKTPVLKNNNSLANPVPTLTPDPEKIRLEASRRWLEERNRTGAGRA
jgi:hypothetical protein